MGGCFTGWGIRMRCSISNTWKEIIGIGCAIAFIVFIWRFYPDWMQSMDDELPKQPAPIVIPYIPGVIPSIKTVDVQSIDEEKTKFQKIGNQYGTYGDSYGSLNTLFSGLAFAILIISLFMQRQELQAQRQELEAQRNEIQESNAIADQQRIITHQQSQLIAQQLRESQVQNFYNLLFIHLEERRRKIEAIRLNPNSTIEGNRFFQQFLNKFNMLLMSYFGGLQFIEEKNHSDISKALKQVYTDTEEQTHKVLADSQYFDYLIFILNFIKVNENLIDKNAVMNIFSSYLSHDEMLCFLIFGSVNIEAQELIRRYNLFKCTKLPRDGYLKNSLKKFYSI